MLFIALNSGGKEKSYVNPLSLEEFIVVSDSELRLVRGTEGIRTSEGLHVPFPLDTSSEVQSWFWVRGFMYIPMPKLSPMLRFMLFIP